MKRFLKMNFAIFSLLSSLSACSSTGFVDTMSDMNPSLCLGEVNPAINGYEQLKALRER